MSMVLSWGAALLLSYVMAAAAWHKLRSPVLFARQLQDYQLLPPALGGLVARLLPIVELALAIGLLVPASRQAAAGATAILVLAYASAIVINLIRGRREIDCGCSGPAVKQPLSAMLLVRNLVLVVFAALGALLSTGGVLSLGVGLLAVAFALACVMLYMALDVYLANRSILMDMQG